MLDSNQFLEKFRPLSREIQLGLQESSKLLSKLKNGEQATEYIKLEKIIERINNDWSDFSYWVLISTLDDLNEAKKNCAPGFIDIRSKVIRSKTKSLSKADQHGVKINNSSVGEATITTYIPYFEQLLDLIFLNAVKYSPRNLEVNVSAAWKAGSLHLSVASIGPLIHKQEVQFIGNLKFRAENAIKTQKPGDGHGLFNAKKLAELLKIKIEFSASQKNKFEYGGIEHGEFCVNLIIPPNID